MCSEISNSFHNHDPISKWFLGVDILKRREVCKNKMKNIVFSDGNLIKIVKTKVWELL